jgi:tetratricopeptide (TPR) repeat protein
MADVTDLTFSPDSHLLAAVSSNEVALWDIDNPTDKPVLLPGHAVSFSPDGTWLATVQDDSVALRRVSLPHLVTLACETVGRNLSWEEWIQFMETQPYRPTCAQQPVHPSVAEALLQQGRELAQQEKVKQATSVFSRVLTLDPTAQIEPVALAHTLLAKTLWQKGQDLAREEDIAAASDMFRQALVHDPSLRINPEQEAERLAVETLQTRAEDLARQGNIEEATRFFTRAKSYSPSLKLDPQARAHHLYAVALYEYGREQAQEGNVTEAITKFQQAKTYSPTMNLDPQQEAWQLAAEKYLADGKEFAQQGNIQEALAYFTDVHTYAPAKISASAWNNLCWWGSLWNQSSDDILAACNHAVRLAPQNGNIRESRGVARALQGDYAGAIEDLTYAREHGSGNQARLDAWIAALEAGQNPFDTPTLRELRELN